MRQVPLKNVRWRIFSTVFFDHLSLNIAFPVLTFVFFDPHSSLFLPATSHAMRSFWYGCSSSAAQIIAIISAPFLCILSDRFGRKKLLLIGSLGAFFSAIFTSLSLMYTSVILFLTGSIIAGIYTRTEPIALASIGDLRENRHKITSMGYLQFFISLGAFIGPLIGGFFAKRFLFAKLNFMLPFLIAVAISLFTFFYTLFCFKETYFSHKHYRYKMREIKNIVLKQPINRLILTLTLTQFSWRIFYQYAPPLLKLQFHETPTQIGIFVSLIAFWLMLATVLGIRWMRQHYRTTKILTLCCYLIFIGLIIAIIAILSPVSTISEIFFWIAAVPISAGDVIAYSAIISAFSNLVSRHHQGLIMGINFTIVSLVWAVTSLLGGGLLAISPVLPIIIAPVGIFLLGLWYVLF